MKMTKCWAWVCAAGWVLLRAQAEGATLYSYDDSAGGAAAGSGVFALDVAAPLGEYQASDVAGSGTTFGTWGAVAFLAHPGTFPSLVISNLVGASMTLSLPGIGGGEIAPGSNADLEWDHFRQSAATRGFVISEFAVPDAAGSLAMLALGLGGLWGARRRVEEAA